MQLKFSCRITACAVLLSVCNFAALKAQQKDLLSLDPAVRTGKLANGFTYFIRHNEEPKNRVVLYLANKVGSVLEDDDQRGLAHFMEHMSFNGTKHFPKNELVNYLQKSGVRFGADLNAYTSFDETVYQLPLPSDNADILNNGIQIMRDWAQDAALDPVEINKERGVVLEEKRLGKGANERMQRRYWPMLLNRSKYTNRLPIGTEEVLNNFKPTTLARFYHTWYRPNLQALIVVGDIDVDKMEQIIKSKFSDLKNPVAEIPRTRYSVPSNTKNQFMVVTDKEMTETDAEIVIKHPAFPLTTKADYRRMIIGQLFNQMLSGRFAELTRKNAMPFIDARARNQSFLAGLDSYNVSVESKPGELENSFKAVWRESERVTRFGFTQTELDRAKLSFLSRLEAALKESNKTPSATYVKEYLQYFLKGEAAPGIQLEYDMSTIFLPGITLSDINTYVKDNITGRKHDIIITAPEKDKAKLPDEVLVNSWMKAVSFENITPYQEVINTNGLLNSQPVAGKIVSETYDQKLGLTTLVLSNGAKVLLKPTDFKNNEILFTGYATGGTSLYSDADYQSAASANIIPAFGIGNYDATQLSNYISDKHLKVQPFVNERFEGLTGGAVNKDLQAAMELIYAAFTAPRLDTVRFSDIIARSESAIANRQNDPNSVYQDTISAVLGNNSPRKTGPSLQKLKEVNINKAFSVYKERFADAAGFTFVFVGSIDTASIKPLLEKYLGSLPALHKNETDKDLKNYIPAGIITNTVYKGSEPKATVNLILSGDFDYSFEDAMKMNAIKEVLQIRLIEKLREEESGVYAPSVKLTINRFPHSRFSLNVSFGCAPENADKLITSTLSEIKMLKTDGPSQLNIDKFKAEDERTTEVQLKTNNFWLSYLNGQLQNKEPLDQIVKDYRSEMDRITPAALKSVAGKYLTGKNIIQLVLKPDTIGK